MQRNIDLRVWCDFVEETEHGVTFNRDLFFKRTSQFGTSLAVEFQNLALLCSELSLEQPNISFLTVLNFEGDSAWEQLLAGKLGSLSLQDARESVIEILLFIDLMTYGGRTIDVGDGADGDAQNLLLSRARDIQRWKLNFLNPVISTPFLRVAQFLCHGATRS